MTKLSYDKWLEKYKPLKPTPDSDTIIFDRIPEGTNPFCVWTYISCDGWDTIQNGFHWVNRIDHYVCEIPFKKGQFIEIVIDRPRCCKCRRNLAQKDRFNMDKSYNEYCPKCFAKLPEEKRCADKWD